MARAPLRIRLGKALLGSKAKEFIPALSALDQIDWSGGGRLTFYRSKSEQLTANVGWCYAANTAIADSCAAVELKLYRKMPDGDREEIEEHELLDLLDNPNLAHTGEQLRQLHFTYMNFVGEGYLLMLQNGEPFLPRKGQLPDALQVVPAHQVQFKLGDTYTKSTLKFGKTEYPIVSMIRDLNPDPGNPYLGRSIIAASSAAIDTENHMKEWNRRFFANNARPSLIFSSEEAMSDESYERWKAQFVDENTGTDNAFKPLLIEGGDAKPYMLSQQDLDFLESRKFSKDEILAMWRVSPAILGMTENVNRSNMDAAIYIHALVNVLPRVRQFVRQLNSTLVSVYDSTLELDFENPVPEDVTAKLEAAKNGVNKWWTIDEVREMYGEQALGATPENKNGNGLGATIYMPNNFETIEVANAATAVPPGADPQNPEDPDDDNDDDLTSGNQPEDAEAASKSLGRGKKKA